MSTDERTAEPSNEQPAADHASIAHYAIRVDGRLGARWATWFDGMDIAAGDDGTTVICGPVVDQAALHGLLQKLRDLGIRLISLVQLDPEQPTSDPHHTSPGATS